jgi:hypothetical protein
VQCATTTWAQSAVASRRRGRTRPGPRRERRRPGDDDLGAGRDSGLSVARRGCGCGLSIEGRGCGGLAAGHSRIERQTRCALAGARSGLEAGDERIQERLAATGGLGWDGF